MRDGRRDLDRGERAGDVEEALWPLTPPVSIVIRSPRNPVATLAVVSGTITLYKLPVPDSYGATAIARGQGRHLRVSSNAVRGS